MMKPAKLLQDLGMVRIPVENASVRGLCSVKLLKGQQRTVIDGAYIFLLLVHMTNLKPDVFLGEWPWWVFDNPFEALLISHSRPQWQNYLQTLRILLLLLVNDAEPKVDLVGFLEVRLHVHHLREGFLGMFERAIAVVENANAIP